MTKRSLRRDAETIASLREPTRRALYEYVERQPTPVSRDQAAEALGLTRPLAAFHLDRLVEAGLLTADYRRLSGRSGPGAGRPAKLYHRSRRQVEISLPRRDHALLAGLLATAMAQGGRDPSAAGPARDFGRSLGSRARRRLRSRVAGGPRLAACVEDVLATIGFEPYRAQTGELRARNCPFDPLSKRFTTVVCGTGQALVGGVIEGVGADHLGVTREERPDRCCVVVEERSPPPGQDRKTASPRTPSGARRARPSTGGEGSQQAAR
jgi:predicted ArsR family transcriptional regulator